jgi:hypothetical protein
LLSRVFARYFANAYLEDFSDGVANLFTGYRNGAWSIGSGRYAVVPGAATGMNILDLGPDNLSVAAYLELTAKLNTAGRAGFVFDRYGDQSFKFAAIDAVADQVIIGHWTAKKGWATDVVVSKTIDAGVDYTLGLTVKATSAAVTLNGQVLTSFAFNAVAVDGTFGLLATGGQASFDDVKVRTDDRAFAAATTLVASGTPGSSIAAPLSETALAGVFEAAKQRWADTLSSGASSLANVHFGVADLSGSILGVTVGDTLFVDADAAGFGWFVDATPLDDTEFWVRRGELLARMGTEARGRMDLLSVVMHELGHVLGRDHEADGVMRETLAPGVRTVPQASLPASTPAGISDDHAYAVLASLAAARVPAAPAAMQPVQPVIDWSARAVDFGLKAAPPIDKAAPHAWAGQFVTDLARDGDERNPNEKLRVQAPVTAKASLKTGSLKR